MKTPELKMNCIRGVALVASTIILAGVATSVQADVLTARALPPQEIHDNHLPEGTIVSGGLLTVGIGEPVYLEALIEKGPSVTGATWNLQLAPAGSTAVIDISPIPMDFPVYSPAKREYMEVADRMMLVPDVTGVYQVEVVVHTTDGDIVLHAQVTGAMYVGSGLVNDDNWTGPMYPQCALCHAWDPDGKVESFTGTGHFTFTEEAIDGIKSSHYSENCIECHNLGGHNPNADNGSFAATAAALGWTYPTELVPGNWAAMPMELKNKANIQCESCHGAGSEHHGIASTISISLDAGDCAQCHDEEPYHNKNRQWEISGHSRNPVRTSGSCAPCHTGGGFINKHNEGSAALPIDGEAIVCAACHDPHSNHGDNHQLRTTADVVLENDHVVTAGGNGKMCMNCHKARRNADDYVAPDEGLDTISTHFGPHYGIQGDLFVGQNAIEYGKDLGGPSTHLYAVEDSCAGCHMQGLSNSDPAKSLAGEHTFKMMADINGTPDDHHDDVAMTGVCTDCHGPLDTFDIPKFDYNYDGVVEGLQTEVHHLLEALAMKLHPVGSPEVIRDGDRLYTLAERKALYNYMCVEEDQSFGMHNPRYITSILRASLDDLSDPFNSILDGVNIPAGGHWFYSPWFDFYAPTTSEGWIYHVMHGYLWVQGDGDNLQIWDNVLKKWLYTNADLYPILLDVEAGTWMYFQGKFGDMRYFYNYGSGTWDIVN